MSHHNHHHRPTDQSTVSRAPVMTPRIAVLVTLATCVTAAVMLFTTGETWYGLGAAGIGLWVLITVGWVMFPSSWHHHEDSHDAPDNVAGVYARQADELASIVETLISEEQDRHAKTMRTLQVLAASLGEQHGELDELAARLAGGDPR